MTTGCKCENQVGGVADRQGLMMQVTATCGSSKLYESLAQDYKLHVRMMNFTERQDHERPGAAN